VKTVIERTHKLLNVLRDAKIVVGIEQDLRRIHLDHSYSRLKRETSLLYCISVIE
jgi:hypothetical protein